LERELEEALKVKEMNEGELSEALKEFESADVEQLKRSFEFTESIEASGVETQLSQLS
jgi:hypothetical protein